MCCTRRDSVAVLAGVIQTFRFKQFDLDQRGFRSETLLASLQIVISLPHLLRDRVHLCAVHSRLCASAKSNMSRFHFQVVPSGLITVLLLLLSLLFLPPSFVLLVSSVLLLPGLSQLLFRLILGLSLPCLCQALPSLLLLLLSQMPSIIHYSSTIFLQLSLPFPLLLSFQLLPLLHLSHLFILSLFFLNL